MDKKLILETQLFLNEVGAKIKAIRQEKKLSRRELGELCKLNYNTIFRIESGKIDSELLTLYNIADKLGVDLKDFM